MSTITIKIFYMKEKTNSNLLESLCCKQNPLKEISIPNLYLEITYQISEKLSSIATKDRNQCIVGNHKVQSKTSSVTSSASLSHAWAH